MKHRRCLGILKEQVSTSVVKRSQYLFKMEVKVDLKPYQGEIDDFKLNHWLQQLDIYFNTAHYIEEE